VRAWFQRGALVLLPAIVLAAPWYLFLYRTYGNLDGFAQIAALQQIWNHPAGSFIDLLIDPEFIVMRFKETWGEFGWRLIHLSPTLLWAIALPQGAALSGFVLYLFSASSGTETAHDDPVLKPAAWQWMGIAVVCATCIIAYLAVVQFGTRFALTQARYYFPAINSFALVLMLGARTLIPPSLRRFGQGAIFAALFFVNLLIFTQYVIPHYLSV
jgi:hypothetical protein